MNDDEINDVCELGVKGSCVTCDYNVCCNGKWSHHGTNK